MEWREITPPFTPFDLDLRNLLYYYCSHLLAAYIKEHEMRRTQQEWEVWNANRRAEWEAEKQRERMLANSMAQKGELPPQAHGFYVGILNEVSHTPWHRFLRFIGFKSAGVTRRVM